MKTGKLLVIAALVLTPTLASAQPAHHVHPVPAPSAAVDEGGGKPVEEEHGPRPIKFWDTQILNNKEPPYAAMLFNFALLVLLYWWLGKKPVVEGLKNRKRSIAALIEEAQKILREAKQRSKRYRAKLEHVAEEAEEAKQSRISTGKGEADEIVRNAQEKAARASRDVQFILSQEEKQAQLDLVRETVEKAAKEAEELLKKNVSSQDQERLAEEFIAQLAADYEKGLPLGGSAEGGTPQTTMRGAS